MTLFLANWASCADFDAHKDDNGYDCIADMAFPTGVLVTSVVAAKALCYQEWKSLYEEEREDELFPPTDTWVWARTDEGYAPDHETWALMEKDDLIGVLSVRPIEVQS